MSGHTPGPWKADQNFIWAEEAIGHYIIAQVLEESLPGDPALLAAAPEMLEALRQLVGCSPESMGDPSPHDLARAAIAKATGSVE